MRLWDTPVYRQLRSYWQRVHLQGGAVCWRCGKPILPEQPMDLGHDDLDKSIIRGPEHRHSRHCPAGGNRATARHALERRRRRRTARFW